MVFFCLWWSVCKSLAESRLGCGSDGVRAKVLVVRGLWIWKGFYGEAERQLCLQSLHNLPYIELLVKGLGCDSDGVRAKVLYMRWLWIWNGLALEQEACLRPPSKFSTLMGLDWRRQRYLWTVLGWLLALMGVYLQFVFVNTIRG